MSLNILKKVYSEAELENRVHVDGEWKVEIVCENGEIKKPLGDKWRKNLIQNKGLNILNGTFTTANTFDAAGGYISNFLRSAFWGPSNMDPFATNKTFLTSNNADIFWTRRLTTNVPENTNPRVEDAVTGSVTYRRVWDFQALASGETRTVQEIVISGSNSAGFTGNDQARGTQGTFNTSTAIISRFILPEAVTLTQFQFLRLYYQIKITVPAIVTPININLQNNGFDATGRLKLLGNFATIFEGTAYKGYRSSFGSLFYESAAPWTPWSIMGREGCSAIFLRGNSNPALNYQFPAVNSNFATITYSTNAWGNAWYDIDDVATVTNVSAGGSMTPGTSNQTEILPVNNSLTREASLLFPANNPSSNGPIAGIFIMPFNSIGFGNPDNYQPGDPAIGGKAWYWQFTDETFSVTRSVTKDLSFGLAINIRQVMARG